MDKSFKKRIPPPGGGWDAFILFWTAVFGGGNAPAKKRGVSAEAAKINSIVLIRFPLYFIANLKTA